MAKVIGVVIRGVHPYSFRSGEWASIVGVEVLAPVELKPRVVYCCEYSDGFVDYISVSDSANYEIMTEVK
jgi:hypothetical protein